MWDPWREWTRAQVAALGDLMVSKLSEARACSKVTQYDTCTCKYCYILRVEYTAEAGEGACGRDCEAGAAVAAAVCGLEVVGYPAYSTSKAGSLSRTTTNIRAFPVQ